MYCSRLALGQPNLGRTVSGKGDGALLGAAGASAGPVGAVLVVCGGVGAGALGSAQGHTRARNLSYMQTHSANPSSAHSSRRGPQPAREGVQQGGGRRVDKGGGGSGGRWRWGVLRRARAAIRMACVLIGKLTALRRRPCACGAESVPK